MKKYAFVPNREYHGKIDIEFSHRSKEFREIYRNCKEKLRKIFSIPEDYEILFVNGSATSAIEAVLSSLQLEDIEIFRNGEFGNRLHDIASKYLKISQESKYLAYCQFETSQSLYNNFDGSDKIGIVDCVSGFGYYDLPKNADIIITCGSKILGGMPVLGIVLIKRFYREKLQSRLFYLDLKKIWDFDDHLETPHTSLLPQYISLLNSLQTFDPKKMRERVNSNCKFIRNSLKNKIEFYGETEAPVLTVHLEDSNIYYKILNTLEEHNIEVYVNPKYMSEKRFQIATYDYPLEAYEYLAGLISKSC